MRPQKSDSQKVAASNARQKPSSNNSSNAAGSLQPTSSAGRLKPTGRSTGGDAKAASLSKAASLKREPSSKRSARSLAASLISSLSAAGNAASGNADSAAAALSNSVEPGQGGSSGANGTTMPAIGSRSTSGKFGALLPSSPSLGVFSQAASASTSSRPPSSGGPLKASGSSSPANTPVGTSSSSMGRASPSSQQSWAGGAAGMLREGSLGSSTESSSLCPTPSARSFTEPGTSTAPSMLGSGLRSKGSGGQQLPPLATVSSPAASSYSLEGGRVMLLKEAAVKFLDPLGQPLPIDSSSTGGSSVLYPVGHYLSSTGGSVTSVPSDWGGSAAGIKADPAIARSRSKVSFHLQPKVSFIECQENTSAATSSSFFTSTNPTAQQPAGSAPGSKPSSSPGNVGQDGPLHLRHAHTASGSLAGGQSQQGSLMQQSPGGQHSMPGGSSSAGQRGSVSGDVTPRGLKGGLAAIANTFKKLALVLDHSSDHDTSSNGSSTNGSSDGDAGVSISPVPTPKDGTSAVRALAYKQHHGYLPSPTASSAGGLRKSFTQKSTTGSGLSRAGSAKLFDAASTGDEGATGAGPVTTSAVSMLSAAGAAVAGAAAAAAGDPGASQTGLSALPPGAVPLFGAAAATAAEAKLPRADALDSLPGKQPGAGTEGPSQGPTCSSRIETSEAGAPKGLSGPFKLGPASLPGPLLLAVSPWLPRNMQRDHWCLSDFVVQKKLYDGYASTICKAKDCKSGTVVALKLYRMHKLNEISSHQVAREVRLHIGLQHENIISLHAAWQEAGNVVLVQEFAGQGDLWSFIDNNSGRLTERVTVSLVLQPFLRGLQFLHSAGIAHRDIKPENVLFGSNMVLKLADFGLAVNLREEPAVTRVGTLDYMAPEVLRCPLKRHPGDNKDRADLHYATAVDAWAVGVLAYELLTGRAPFTAAGASDASIQSAICTAAPSFPSRMSEPAKQFITAALNKVPSARPTVLHMLQHPWIRSFQRSCSNTRAEPRTSQELGGTGRLLLPSTSTHQAEAPQPAQPAGQSGLPTSTTSHGTLAMQRQASLISRSSSLARKELAMQGPAASGMDNALTAAAAAGVWNSDDNGLTGYATGQRAV